MDFARGSFKKQSNNFQPGRCRLYTQHPVLLHKQTKRHNYTNLPTDPNTQTNQTIRGGTNIRYAKLYHNEQGLWDLFEEGEHNLRDENEDLELEDLPKEIKERLLLLMPGEIGFSMDKVGRKVDVKVYWIYF